MNLIPDKKIIFNKWSNSKGRVPFFLSFSVEHWRLYFGKSFGYLLIKQLDLHGQKLFFYVPQKKGE